MASVYLRVLTFAAALNAGIALASHAQAAAAANEICQETWVMEASMDLEPRALDALQRIMGVDRRLLALRAYLRAGDALAERWSWSQEQLSAYPSTPEGKAATADIDAVVVAFAAANPGFTLQVNRKLRSLELQIAHWNENESVGTVAAALVTSLEQRFAGNSAKPSADELRKALMDWKPAVAAALAAPGLSAHGQGRAFDFQVERSGQIIAGMDVTSASRQWDAAGWTQKLRAAVGVAGNHFAGPLESPYEPWHYAYMPIPIEDH